MRFLNSANVEMLNAHNNPPPNIIPQLNTLIVAIPNASRASNVPLIGVMGGMLLGWKKAGRVSCWRRTTALRVISDDNTTNVDPAKKRPS